MTHASQASVMPVAASAPELDLDRLDGVPVCETHGSRVFLAGDRAYKVRKPVKFPFLDQSTPERRRELALSELTLNRELAPGTYLGVRTLTNSGGAEVAVEMRRFQERDTLAARLADGRSSQAMLEALGRRIATFHAGAPAERITHPAVRTITKLHGAADGWATHEGGERPAWEVWRTALALERRVLARADEITDRADAGMWREGHGDLRADHVVIDERGLSIVDRLEFDRELRVSDVGDDLAFLLMDLRSRGGVHAAKAVLRGYREGGGDPGDDRLLALWCGCRALISLEVAVIRQAQPGGPDARRRATALLAVAAECVWEARNAHIIVVCGAPATGKSTLAEQLASRSGWPVVNSDLVRKRLLGLAPTDRAPVDAYGRAQTLDVYRELGRLARHAQATSGGVIVDATMGARACRRAFAEALGQANQAWFVECWLPAGLAERRAAARRANPAAVSDADEGVARRLRASFEPLDEAQPERHLVCRTDRSVQSIADEIELRLDLQG